MTTSAHGAARRRLGLALCAASWLLAGCNESAQPTSRRAAAQRESQQDHVAAAGDYLRKYADAEPEYTRRNTLYYLNRWLAEQPAASLGEPDPLVGQLARHVRGTPLFASLTAREFQPYDGHYLLEAAMLRDVAERTTAAELADPILQQRLGEASAALDRDAAAQLAATCRLFDWTIRNIQLDSLLPYPQDPVAGPGPAAGAGPAAPPPPPPLRGEPGPGYRFQVGQVLLFGHGDAWQRARVFIQLARQQQLDVVLLAVDDSAAAGRPRPWLCGAVVGEEIFLFDPALGLALPGADGQGIATLRLVREQPELLRRLDFDAQHPYDAGPEDLERLVVLIDAPPSSLAPRMAAVAPRLSGANTLVVAVEPSRLAERLRSHPGVGVVRLWSLAFDVELYRATVAERLPNDLRLRREYAENEALFVEGNALTRARRKHISGQWNEVDERPGAKGLYLTSRSNDDKLDLLESSPVAQQELGIAPYLSTRPEERAIQLRAFEMALRQSKDHATYWLGLVNYDAGKFDIARDWLQRAMDERRGPRWLPGARYNLARTYEQLGRLDDARSIYLGDESPQRHGNLLRARWLAELK